MKAKQETMPRGEFLKELGLSSAALMAFYCMGTTMTSCTNAAEAPTPVAPTPPVVSTGITGNSDKAKGPINFTLDLTNDNFKTLKTEGKFAYTNDIIIANVKGGKFVAISKVCTHQSTTIEYRLAKDDFWCSNHGSEFAADGKVKTGPAAKALAVYKTELSANGNTLTVKE
jgi:cytochrome b6-f complex iron-sulfur subunit